MIHLPTRNPIKEIKTSCYQIIKSEIEMESAVVVLFFAWVSRTFARTSFEGCTKLNTYGYEYLRLYEIPTFRHVRENSTEGFYFEFYVKTASNAIIMLRENFDADAKAYEIVIGGGKNSFSQIRLYPRQPKVTVPTENIVSPEEYKGFWIKLDTIHVLLVGRIGETDPFLFWVNVDHYPFNVEAVAFSSWNGVKGEWYFDCDNKSDSEAEGNVTAIYRLKHDLLNLYNPTIAPQREEYLEESIEIHLEATYFHLDEKSGELFLDGMAYVNWTDWKLTWEPNEYEGIEIIYVTPYQIWTPNFRIVNSLSLGKNFLLSLSGNVAVTSKGEIAWRVPFHSVTLCLLGYRNWPFDMHNCSLVFEFLEEPLQLVFKEVSLSKVYKSEWEILKINGKQISISHVNGYGSIIEINFSRRDPSYEFFLFPPFIGAAALALISFWLPPKSSIKLFLNCGSILILILILMSMIERIAMVSATPRIVELYSWTVLVMCIPIIFIVGLKYIPPSIHLPRRLSSLLNSSVVEIVFFLPENSNSQLNYSHLREQEERFISAVRLVTLIERIVFIFHFFALFIPLFLFFYEA